MNMIGKAKQEFATLIFIAMLSSCQPLLRSSQTATLTPITVNNLNAVSSTPTPSSTRPPTSTPITSTPTPESISTATPVPASVVLSTLPNPPTRSPKVEFPQNLILNEWRLVQDSQLDRRYFEPVQGTREQILERYQSWRDSYFDILPSPLIQGYYNKVMLNAHELIVNEELVDSKSLIHVIYEGKEITQVDAGNFVPPKTNIWGLWTYENHWIMEYMNGFHDLSGNSYHLGNIIWDGESFNSKFDYQESFGLTAINGRILYFFRRNDQIGISYDGIEYNLEYDAIQHYQCCLDDAYENPSGIGMGWLLNQNLSFFAERNGDWYFVVIWAQ